MTLADVLPTVQQLSAAEKLKLIQILAQELEASPEIASATPAQLETLDILEDREFADKLHRSIAQAEQGQAVSWQSTKAQLGL